MMDWHPIPGHPGYEISRDGQVRSWRNGRWGNQRRAPRLLSQHVGNHGYLVVSLPTKGRPQPHLLHRLLLLTFVGPPPPGMESRHLNGDKLDNRLVENLCWGSRSENMADRVRHGVSNRGERQGQARLTSAAARIICRMELSGKWTQKWIAEAFGISRQAVYGIASGRNWRHATEDILHHAGRA